MQIVMAENMTNSQHPLGNGNIVPIQKMRVYSGKVSSGFANTSAGKGEAYSPQALLR